MPNSKNKKSVNVDKETYESFEYMYPKLTALFINRALFLASQNKDLFEEIFFNKIFLEVK